MLSRWTRTTKKKAFTLLELIVVIVILGVLAAIAVPTFAKVIEKSSDEATLTSLRAMAREAQALRAFDQTEWNDTQVTATADDTSAAAPGTYAARKLVALPDTGKDPIDGQVTYKIAGEGLALAKLSDTGRVCVVGANHSKVEKGSCGPSEATSTDSTLGMRLSDPDDAVLPPSTSTGSAGGGGSVTNPDGLATPVITQTLAGVDNGQVYFDLVPGATSYKVVCTPASGTPVVSDGNASSPVNMGPLSPSTTYSCTVAATNGTSTTVSAPVELTTQADPNAPSGGTGGTGGTGGSDTTATVGEPDAWWSLDGPGPSGPNGVAGGAALNTQWDVKWGAPGLVSSGGTAVSMARSGYLYTSWAPGSTSVLTESIWYKADPHTNGGVLMSTRGALGQATPGIAIGYGSMPAECATGEAWIGFHGAGYFDGICAVGSYLTDGTAHHVVGVWDGSNASQANIDQLRVYVDGVEYSTAKGNTKKAGAGVSTAATLPLSPRYVTVGAEEGQYYPATGTLDEPRVYKQALTAAQVQSLYNAGK